MVEIIGFVTIGVLVLVLAWALAGESDAERRRITSLSGRAPYEKVSLPGKPQKRAA